MLHWLVRESPKFEYKPYIQGTWRKFSSSRMFGFTFWMKFLKANNYSFHITNVIILFSTCFQTFCHELSTERCLYTRKGYLWQYLYPNTVKCKLQNTLSFCKMIAQSYRGKQSACLIYLILKKKNHFFIKFFCIEPLRNKCLFFLNKLTQTC